jgi:hypothetical protein
VAYLSNTGTFTVYYRIADHLRALSGVSYASLATVTQNAAGELGRIRAGFPGKVCQLKLVAVGGAMQVQYPIIIKARQSGEERAFP